MSHHAVRRSAAILALLLIVSGPVYAGCSSNTVRGAWAFQSEGIAMMPLPGYPMPVPVPFVSQGVMDIGWNGALTLRATISVGGQIQDVEGSGSIQVNRDCTATMTDSLGSTAQVVILDEGREMRVMATTHPLGPVTNVALMRRISRGEPLCTTSMVRGAYRGSGMGTYMVQLPGQPQPVPMPFSAIFTLSFDGDGGGTGTAIGSLGGNISNVTFTEMSLTVNRDCTATLTYIGDVKQFPGQVFSGTMKYIVLGHGDELIGIDVESSVGLPIELDSHKRVSLRPGFGR